MSMTPSRTALDVWHLARVKTLVSLVIWALYFVACVLPVADSRSEYGLVTGFGALVWGWIPPRTIPWSANILLLVGWVLLLWGKDIAALVLGIAAVGLGLSTWLFLERLFPGYYLWQASLLALPLGACAIMRLKQLQKTDSFWATYEDPMGSDVETPG
jgi:hypothetical protein